MNGVGIGTNCGRGKLALTTTPTTNQILKLGKLALPNLAGADQGQITEISFPNQNIRPPQRPPKSLETKIKKLEKGRKKMDFFFFENLDL